VRQLDAVVRQFPGALAAGTPLLPGVGVLAFIDMDAMQKRVVSGADVCRPITWTQPLEMSMSATAKPSTSGERSPRTA
jgi:hypothetical protein